MNQKETTDFVGLLKSAIDGKAYAGTQINWPEILKASGYHRVDNLIYEAAAMLPDAQKPSQTALDNLKNNSVSQILQDANQISEDEALMAEFEGEKIRAIMLKGWIMKDLYPRTDLRSRADTDIFIHASDEKKVHQILRKYGYKTVSYGGKKDSVYHKDPFITLEIHKNLFEYEEHWNKMLADTSGPLFIWNRIKALGGYKYIYRMDSEFYYVYMVAHMAKHLMDDGGIGIRAFMDLWIYRENYNDELDFGVIDADFKALNLTLFAKRAYQLACAWFAGETVSYPDDSYRQFGDYIIHCGAFGNSDNFVMNNEVMRGEKKPGSLAYVLKRAFPGRASMETRYPELKNRPVLLPIYWVKRLWYTGVHRANAVKGEIKSAKNVDYDKAREIRKMYCEWGLE